MFTFTEGDQIADYAKTNGQYLRGRALILKYESKWSNPLPGHNLVWYQQLPDWVTANNYNATGLTAVIQNHISNVAGHYKGQP